MDIQNVSELDNVNDFSKTELFKRKNIVIVSSISENYNSDSTANYIKFLNSQYKLVTGDVAPYHYYVDVNGTIYSSKFDTLKLNATSELYGFDNDILILVLNRDLTKILDIQRTALINLVAQLCEQYVISGDDILFFPASYIQNNDAINASIEIISSVIDIRNNSNSLNYIYENTDNVRSSNKYIGISKAEENCFTFNDLSIKFSISEDKLRLMNPQILTENPVPGNLIFYAQTSITTANDATLLIKKMSDMYYKLCEINIPNN